MKSHLHILKLTQKYYKIPKIPLLIMAVILSIIHLTGESHSQEYKKFIDITQYGWSKFDGNQKSQIITCSTQECYINSENKKYLNWHIREIHIWLPDCISINDANIINTHIKSGNLSSIKFHPFNKNLYSIELILEEIGLKGLIFPAKSGSINIISRGICASTRCEGWGCSRAFRKYPKFLSSIKINDCKDDCVDDEPQQKWNEYIRQYQTKIYSPRHKKEVPIDITQYAIFENGEFIWQDCFVEQSVEMELLIEGIKICILHLAGFQGLSPPAGDIPLQVNVQPLEN